MPPLSKKQLKISDLSKESGLPVSTIRHYINEGLLGTPRKTSKNMAYYDRDSLAKIALIKSLQDELKLSLKEIKELLTASKGDPSYEAYNLVVEVKKRLAENTGFLPKMTGLPHSEVFPHLTLTEEEMLAIEKMGAISPEVKDGEKYYDEVDYRVIKALSDARASGFSKEFGFSTDDLDVYVRMMKEIARRDAIIFAQRIALSGKSPEEIAELMNKGLLAVDEIISSLHQKFAIEALKEMEKTARDIEALQEMRKAAKDKAP